MGLSGVFSWLDWGCTFSKNAMPVMLSVSQCRAPLGWGYLVSLGKAVSQGLHCVGSLLEGHILRQRKHRVCIQTSPTNFPTHWWILPTAIITLVSAKMVTFYSLFSSSSLSWSSSVRKNCSYFHIYLLIQVYLYHFVITDIYFILRVWLHYYHYLFHCSTGHPLCLNSEFHLPPVHEIDRKLF